MAQERTFEIKAADIARVCLDDSCMQDYQCEHDGLIILKSGVAYKARLDARELLYLCDNGLSIAPFDKEHVKDAMDDDEEKEQAPLEGIHLDASDRLQNKIDPKDHDTIAKHVAGWPCRAMHVKRLGEIADELQMHREDIEALETEQQMLREELRASK
jgi:hypothetical protein